MNAQTGDRITVHGRHVGERDRQGVITAVRGANGAPPYVVRWEDGQEGVFFPGPDASVEHITRSGRGW